LRRATSQTITPIIAKHNKSTRMLRNAKPASALWPPAEIVTASGRGVAVACAVAVG
jgi:hypothetical protein